MPAHLDRIAAVDGDVHAFLHVDGDRALAQAAAVDHRIAGGEKLGPLAGVPLALKDILANRGVPPPADRRSSRAGSRRTTRPSPGGCGTPIW